MGRHDNENVDFLNLPDENVTEADYYTDEGEIIERDDYMNREGSFQICAKRITNQETKLETYFILCDQHIQMFDPRISEKRYRTRKFWKFRRVSKATFDLYIKFLKQKYTSLLRQAERAL